ncbi:MAG: SpoIID/LytB domain-containing protein [Bacteriovoracaceae bacterium]|nr:SpoIID/LytB domain-containing protein [Bacteriovoracaceae bacterium]
MGQNFFSQEGRKIFRFGQILGWWSLTAVALASIKVPTYQHAPKIRVRIGKDLASMEVSGVDLKRMIYPLQDQRSFAGRKMVRFNCLSKLPAKGNSTLLASFSSKTGLLALGDEKYHGKLYVLANEGHQNCDVINELSMEYYLASLLSKEMNASWHQEALKAQAVAARSYALYKMLTSNNKNSFFDLESSERDQVSGTFLDATNATSEATMQTRGEILVAANSGRLTPIFYHAQCAGGKTLLPSQVWGDQVEGYQSVSCKYSERPQGKGDWDGALRNEQMFDFLRWAAKIENLPRLRQKLTATAAAHQALPEILVAPDRLENVQLRLYVDDQVVVLNKPLMRRFFGRTTFPSNHFVLQKKNGLFVLNGKGLGHGVGMPQLGAKTMAEQGWSYREILKYYFPGHRLKKIY